MDRDNNILKAARDSTYVRLRQNYDALRWEMLTSSGGTFDQLVSIVKLTHNRIKTASHKGQSRWNALRQSFNEVSGYLAWQKAHAENDFSYASKPLQKIIENADCAAQLDEQSPGLKRDAVEALMHDTLSRHIELQFEQASDTSGSHENVSLKFAVDAETQKKIVSRLLNDLGVDLNALKLKEGAHPACFGAYDQVYMSACYNEEDLLQTILDMVHEAGHALYRQNLPKDLEGQGEGWVSGRDMDEAMALFWEHAIARQTGFAAYVERVIKEETQGDINISSNQIYKRLRERDTTNLRVNADVMRYPLDLIQRHAVATRLADGKFPASAAKAKFCEAQKAYMDTLPMDDRHGILQDPHWFVGDIADFDNYFMGQNYALSLFDQLTKEYRADEMNVDIYRGDFSTIRNWLNEKIWQHGATKRSQDLVKEAIGQSYLSADGYERFARQYCL